jgi:hypothetical protein
MRITGQPHGECSDSNGPAIIGLAPKRLCCAVLQSAYASALAFSATVPRDLRDLRPRDQIDLQSFIWGQGSDEYD